MIRRPARSTRTDPLVALHGALPISVIGVHVFVDGDAAFVIALLLTAACTWAAHRLGLTVSTAILGVGTLCWWLVTLGRGLAAIDTSDRKSTRLNSSH